MIKKIDEVQRQKVIEFDKNKDSYDALMRKLIIVMMAVFSVMFSIIYEEKICYFALLFMTISVQYIISGYENVKERDNKIGSVFEKTRFAPIDKEVFIQVRMIYVVKYLNKVVFFSLIARALVCLAMMSFDLGSFLFIIVAVYIVPLFIAWLKIKLIYSN